MVDSGRIGTKRHGGN